MAKMSLAFLPAPVCQAPSSPECAHLSAKQRPSFIFRVIQPGEFPSHQHGFFPSQG